MIIDDRYTYTVTLNGIQGALLEGLVGRGIYGRNASDVIRRILDERFEKMLDIPQIDILSLLKAK